MTFEWRMPREKAATRDPAEVAQELLEPLNAAFTLALISFLAVDVPRR